MANSDFLLRRRAFIEDLKQLCGKYKIRLQAILETTTIEGEDTAIRPAMMTFDDSKVDLTNVPKEKLN